MTEKIEWEGETIVTPRPLSLQELCTGYGLAQPEALPGELLVFLNANALAGLQDFLNEDTGREHGGVLLGLPYIDPVSGVPYVDVQAAIPALDTEGTPVHLQFTAAAWEYISGLMAEEHPDRVIVGWFHSHPGLGVFMSTTDAAAQRAFYNQPWHLALVVDPLLHASAWFYGPECTRLRRSQVNVYSAQPPVETQLPERRAAGEWERTYRRSQDWFKTVRWLLPIFLLLGAAILLGWLLPGLRNQG